MIPERKSSFGEFTDYITIQQPTVTQDDYGGTTTTWGSDQAVWARAYQSRGEQALSAGRENATRVVRFKMPYRSMDTTWRIVWGGVNYDIHEVDDTERYTGLVVWVTAKAAADGAT